MTGDWELEDLCKALGAHSPVRFSLTEHIPAFRFILPMHDDDLAVSVWLEQDELALSIGTASAFRFEADGIGALGVASFVEEVAQTGFFELTRGKNLLKSGPGLGSPGRRHDRLRQWLPPSGRPA